MEPNAFKPIAQTPEQIREHYEIETGLARRLLASAPDERQAMYCSVYDELFRRVPSHPQLRKKHVPEARQAEIGPMARVLTAMLSPTTTYMEIGAGDCALARRLAPSAGRVYAVDVSAEVMPAGEMPANLELVVGDGRSIPVGSELVDLAFSNQLLEHLHPDDLQLHLREVLRTLKPGGQYFIVTPNRLTGPHDVSRHFDEIARGLHLREYRIADLVAAGREAGYARSSLLAIRRGRGYRLPMGAARLLEGSLEALPRSASRRLLRFPRLPALLGINIILTR